MIVQLLGGSRGGGNPPWLITMADLLALLLTFFVMLFAMSSLRAPGWHAVADSLAHRFQPGVFVVPAGRESVRVPLRHLGQGEDLGYLAAVLEGKLKSDPTLASAEVRLERDAILVAFASGALFAPGSADLPPRGAQAVASLATVLREIDNRVVIHGAADTGSEGNGPWILSLRRAWSLAQVLSEAGYRLPVAVIGDNAALSTTGEAGSREILLLIRAEHRNAAHAS